MTPKEIYINYILKQINTTPYITSNFLKNRDGEFNYRNSFFNLKNHIDNFLEGNTENRFIVMPGLRGVGKSTLLFQIYNYLKTKGIANNRILYIPVDELKSLYGANLLDLINVFVEDFHQSYPASLDNELFLLIDEAQEDKNWSKTGKIIFDQTRKIFMIFTGSNALDFESDINSLRRTSFERIYPMNFQEFLYLKYNIPKIPISNDLMNLFLNGDIEEASKKEREFLSNISALEKPLRKEFEYFLSYGGFPLNFNMDEVNTHRRIYELVVRVIENDVYRLKAFNGNTKNVLFYLLSFLATQKPGGLSINSFSKNIGASRSNIIELLAILEKTHLIFHLNPYGGFSKMIRNPRKYYFLSPSINAAINFTLGKHNPAINDYLGNLAETLVASSFFKLNNTISKPNGIFTPTEKRMADFIITSFEQDKIAVEVGIGKKNKKQVKKTMNAYDCCRGLVISNSTSLIKKEDEIIYLPLSTFALM